MSWKEKLYTISTGFSTTLWRIWGQTMILRRFYMARKKEEEKISGAKGYIIKIEAKKQAEMACLPPSGRDRRPGTQKDTHTWSGSAAQCVGVKRILPEEGAPPLSQGNLPGGAGILVVADCVSLASVQAQKLAHFVAPPLPAGPAWRWAPAGSWVLSQGNVTSGVGVEVQAGRAAGLPLVVSLTANHGGVVFPMKHGFMGAPPI